MSKIALITGGNRGIGKETAKKLATEGFQVILACRDLEAARKAQNEIINETHNPNIIIKHLDLSRQRSIREFALDINENFERLHVLIHNAAVVCTRVQITEDDLEMTMATNHFGPFLLTHLLIDLLKKSAPSRIVVVSSITYLFSSLNLSNLNAKSALLPQILYFDSKYANICFTKELALRLQGTGVTANCLHPGLIATDIWDSIPQLLRWIVDFLRRSLFKTVEEGCSTSIYLASSDEAEGITGKYFVDCEEGRIWRRIDVNTTKKLWEVSEKLSGLRRTDPTI